jgi:hypothetical protein
VPAYWSASHTQITVCACLVEQGLGEDEAHRVSEWACIADGGQSTSFSFKYVNALARVEYVSVVCARSDVVKLDVLCVEAHCELPPLRRKIVDHKEKKKRVLVWRKRKRWTDTRFATRDQLTEAELEAVSNVLLTAAMAAASSGGEGSA